MKKGKTKNQTIHIPGQQEKTLCGKPAATSTLWAKKSPPTKEHPGLCKKCCAEFLKAKTGATGKELAERSAETGVEKKERKAMKRQPALLALGERMPNELRVTFKGKEYLAAVNPDGTILVEGHDESFNSPSRAGKAVTGREVDGWTFWSYGEADGTLKKLDTLRKENVKGI